MSTHGPIRAQYWVRCRHMDQSEVSIGTGDKVRTNQMSQLTALSVWIAAEMGPDLQQRQHRRLWPRLIPAHRRGRHFAAVLCLNTEYLGAWLQAGG